MKYSVLITDDSEEDRFLLKRFLKKTGLDISIAEAQHGEEAIDFLTRFDEKYAHMHPEMCAPLIVFLDVNMPIMNGWEFLEVFQSRADEVQLQPTVCVMYSTSEMHEDKARSAQFDCVETYVVKGDYSVDQLKQTLIDCTIAYRNSAS